MDVEQAKIDTRAIASAVISELVDIEIALNEEPPDLTGLNLCRIKALALAKLSQERLDFIESVERAKREAGL